MDIICFLEFFPRTKHKMLKIICIFYHKDLKMYFKQYYDIIFNIVPTIKSGFSGKVI